MQIRVQCSCGRAFSVAAERAGRREFCPMCGVQCLVPAAESRGLGKVALFAGGAVVLAGVGYSGYRFFGRTPEDAGANGSGRSGVRVVEESGAKPTTGNGGPVRPTPPDPGPRNPDPTPSGIPADIVKRANERIADLASHDVYVRARAARELAEMGPEIEPLLRDAVGRGVAWAKLVLRAFAWRRLLSVETQAKYAREIVSLNSDDDATRVRVIEGWISAQDGECSPMLSDLVEDDSAEVRVAALNAAAQFRAQVSAAGIARVLEDDRHQVLGVFAAGILGISEAAGRIRPLLSDPSMRDLAVTTLGLLRDWESAEEIARDVAAADPRARARAFEAIGRIGRFPGGFPIDAIRDPDPEVRQAVFVAAGRCREVSLQNPMAQLLADSDPRMRRAGAVALGELGQDTAIPNLLPLLSDTDAGVRYEVTRALGRLRHRGAVPAMVEMLDDQAVAEAASDDAPLRSLLDTQAVRRLRPSVSVPAGRQVREGALLALEEVTGQEFAGETTEERIASARAWWARAQPDYPR